MPIPFTRVVWSSARGRDASELNASSTVSSRPIRNQSTGRGICKNHSTSSGSSGTAFPTVATTAWLHGRKKGRNLATSLSSITGSGLFNEFMGSRDVELTERLDYSSAVAFLGFSLILAILRAFNVRDEAARVMVSAPIVAFITTHILYLNFFHFDYGLNMKVCVAMGIAQLLIWAIWAGVTHHPSRLKLWFVVISGGLAMLLEIFDFPPYYGYVDAHALWHVTTIPLTYLWWSFVRDDAVFRTSTLLKKSS